MCKKLTSAFLVLSMLLSMALPAFAVESSAVEAVYLGVQGYGTVTSADKDDFQQRFFVNGEEVTYLVSGEDNYAIQNTLQEGYLYRITVEDGVVTAAELLDKGHENIVMGTVTAQDESSITVGDQQLTVAEGVKTYAITTAVGGASVEAAEAAVGDSVKVVVDGTAAKTIYKAFVAEEYTAPVQGEPGVKTLKNFLATALEPVGTALYVYGGAWDWQDVKSSNQSMTIGIPQAWIDFFQSQDASYTYKNSDDKAHSYYPHNGWNQYYYAGVDCSAYVAWIMYNVLDEEADPEGYVMGSTKMAKTFGETYDWGVVDYGQESYVDEDGDQHRTYDESTFGVGDVFSMNGHSWISLGTCEDGSIVFLHSTPSGSVDGKSGGGIQISALNPNDTGTDCQAYQLADHYMTTYFPAWSKRYDAVLKSYTGYTDVYGTTAGKFSWDLTGTKLLTDPDGYADMTPAQILADLFGENKKEEQPDQSDSTDNVVSTPVTSVVSAADSFQDVSKDSWYYEAVANMADKGLMNGVTTNTFAPDTTLSRGMIAQILYSLNGDKEMEFAKAFADIASDDWYADAVNWAASCGIVSGYGDGVFGAEESMTREQMALILYRYASMKGYDTTKRAQLNDFADGAQTSSWAADAMEWAVANGLLAGMGDGVLAPNGTATRAQVAVVLSQFVTTFR